MTDFMMDVDGPEFLLELNHQIAEFRQQDVTAGPTIVGSNEWSTYYEEPTPGMNCDYSKIAVLDTNFLISNMGYLKALTSQAEAQQGSLLVIVPWVVVQELDGLKMHNRIEQGRGGNVGDLARIAMRFLEDALRKKRMWLRGQKTDEIYDRNARLTKGDDSILDCCRYFQQFVRPVTLFTNDRNLAIKAMIHEITSLSSENKVQLMEFASALVPPTHYHQPGQQQQQVDVVDADGDVVFMDMDESEDIDVAAANQQLYSVYASKHAPANYVPSQSQSSEKNKKPATKYYNTALYNSVYNNKTSSASNYDTRKGSKSSNKKYSFKSWNDAPVRDRNGEVLVPPSSSAGRLEEMRKKKLAQKAINPSLRHF